MWKVKVASVLYGAFIVVASILDPTVTAALIGGIALLLNTILTFWLMRYEKDRNSVDNYNRDSGSRPVRRRRKHRRQTEPPGSPDNSDKTDTNITSVWGLSRGRSKAFG